MQSPLALLQVRDLYMTFRNFRNRLADFVRFRQVGQDCLLICANRSGLTSLNHPSWLVAAC